MHEQGDFDLETMVIPDKHQKIAIPKFKKLLKERFGEFTKKPDLSRTKSIAEELFESFNTFVDFTSDGTPLDRNSLHCRAYIYFIADTLARCESFFDLQSWSFSYNFKKMNKSLGQVITDQGRAFVDLEYNSFLEPIFELDKLLAVRSFGGNTPINNREEIIKNATDQIINMMDTAIHEMIHVWISVHYPKIRKIDRAHRDKLAKKNYPSAIRNRLYLQLPEEVVAEHGSQEIVDKLDEEASGVRKAWVEIGKYRHMSPNEDGVFKIMSLYLDCLDYFKQSNGLELHFMFQMVEDRDPSSNEIQKKQSLDMRNTSQIRLEMLTVIDSVLREHGFPSDLSDDQIEKIQSDISKAKQKKLAAVEENWSHRPNPIRDFLLLSKEKSHDNFFWSWYPAQKIPEEIIRLNRFGQPKTFFKLRHVKLIPHQHSDLINDLNDQGRFFEIFTDYINSLTLDPFFNGILETHFPFCKMITIPFSERFDETIADIRMLQDFFRNQSGLIEQAITKIKDEDKKRTLWTAFRDRRKFILGSELSQIKDRLIMIVKYQANKNKYIGEVEELFQETA